MATASYAFPNARVHSGGHAHSHSRKSMTQRVPLQPTSMNGGHSISGGSLINNLKFHANTQASAQEQFSDTDGDHFDSTADLPAAHLHSPNSSAKKRPKVMDRRRSVGLPTHLSLRDSGYGYQPASNQKFMPIDEEAERFVLSAVHGPTHSQKLYADFGKEMDHAFRDYQCGAYTRSFHPGITHSLS